jgi:hypothetical protein
VRPNRPLTSIRSKGDMRKRKKIHHNGLPTARRRVRRSRIGRVIMAPLVVACSFHQLPNELHRKIFMLAASAQPQSLELDKETARSIRGVSRRWAAVGVEVASQIRVPFDYANSRSLKHLRALLLKAPQVDFLDANIGRGYHKTLMGILGEHKWQTLALQRHAQDDRVWASSGLTLRSLSSTNVGACVIKQGLKWNH